MKPFLSVRFRLFALCTGLLLVLGGANLLLGQINRQHEDQVLQQQEQYRRVSVINAVQQAMGTYRFWLGQINTAGMLENAAAEQQARHRLEQARATVDERLAELQQFDPAAVQVIRDTANELPLHMHKGVVALLKKRPEAEFHFAEATRLLNATERALESATQREQALAEEVQRKARDNARAGIRFSLWVIVASAAFGLILSYLVLRSIVRPLQTTVKALRHLNAGETSIDLPPVSHDEFGDMAVALRQFRDQAEHLRRLAYHDSLTGTGNRARLEESLREGIETARQNGTQLALLYLDLDNFSTVNDSLGHSAGDRYLCEAVERLQRFVPDEALICRYGGDKFTVLLPGIPGWDADTLQSHLRSVTDQVLRGMAEPCQIGGDLLPMSVSVGIAVFPTDGQTGEQLVSSADAAMYLAKRHGRNNAQFASPELTGDARRQLATVTDIRRGLDSGEFEPFYQPVVDVTEGRVVGAEALLRWRHPQRGIVMAGEFIPAAEASGLIHALGEECMTRACTQAAKWSSGGADAIRISVNLSARQIEDRTALPFLERLHGTDGLGAQGLDFEITETAILQHIDRAQETLKQIQSLGHRLSVDDFGTGYSSLVYLQRFPINRIKIDRSFVARVETSREAQAIISATVALARSLDLEVVAEGVETAGQLRQLQTMGCTLQQGFYFTPALPAEEFDAWRHAESRRLAAAAAAA
jgi:diguanylate cyclase (GGDEF)-like protein